MQHRRQLLQKRCNHRKKLAVLLLAASQDRSGVQHEVPQDPTVLIVRGAVVLLTHLAQRLSDHHERGLQTGINDFPDLMVHGVRHLQHRGHQIGTPRELRVRNYVGARIEPISSESAGPTEQRLGRRRGRQKGGEERRDGHVDGLLEVVRVQIV